MKSASETGADPPVPSRTELVPLCLGQFMGGVVVVTLGPLLSPVMRDLHVSLSHGGFVSMGFFLGRALGVLALLLLLARVSMRLSLVAGYLVQAGALAATAMLTTDLESFFAYYSVVGLAAAVSLAVPGMWVSAYVRVGTARVMSLVVAFYALSTVLTPWVIGWLLGAGSDWNSVLLGEAVLSLLLAIVTACFPLRDIPGRQNLRWRQLREVGKFNPALIAGILAAGFAYVGMESMLNVWLPKFHQSVYGVGPALAGLAVTFFWLGQLVGRLTVARVTSRLRTSRLMLGLALFSIVLPTVIAVSSQVEVSMVAVFCTGLAFSGLWPLLSSYCGRFPSWYAGVIYAAMGLAAAFGSASLPYVVGPVAAAWGFRPALAMVAVPAVVVALLAFYVARVSRDRVPRASDPKEVSETVVGEGS